MANKRKPRSPYAKYNKAPYKYSEAYVRTVRARDGSDEERLAADAAFRKVHGIPTWDIDPLTGKVKNFPRLRQNNIPSRLDLAA